MYKINDIQASAYFELPEKDKNNKSIINISNYDQFCFLWCILAYLYPFEDHQNRTSIYSIHMQSTFGVNKFILEGSEFPM